jgi:hypothetical protein
MNNNNNYRNNNNNYRNNNNTYNTLSSDQQRLIDMYVNQYNQTNDHIEHLYDMLDDIRNNIHNVISYNLPRRTRMNRRNSNSNSNSQINRFINQLINERQNNLIHYDYNVPINPNIYNSRYFTSPVPSRNTSPTNTSNQNINPNTATNTLNRNINTNTATNTSNRNINTNTAITNFLTSFLNSTVTVRPTNEQIQSASRNIRYRDIENPLSESCPISLEHFEQDDTVTQLIPCGHIFHQAQFNIWFDVKIELSYWLIR